MKNHFKNAQELLNYIAEESIVFVDFRFTDYKGKWHHVSFHHSALDEDMLEIVCRFGALGGLQSRDGKPLTNRTCN